MGFRMVKIFLTSDDPWRSDSNISRDVLFCLQNSVLFLFVFYISTDEVVESYCYRSRDQYFMVTKLRNYSTTAEATMTKFKLSSEAIYLEGKPK